MFDESDCEAEELRGQRTYERRYNQRFLSHPDCSDPDHPGCENCREDGGEE